MNSIHTIGNLTRDVELRFLTNGTPVGKFGLAINEKKKDSASGEYKDAPVFVDITIWGNQAETLANNCKKGSKIAISGRLAVDEWQDKQTQQKRTKLYIVAENFEFLSWDKGGQQSRPAPTARPQTR